MYFNTCELTPKSCITEEVGVMEGGKPVGLREKGKLIFVNNSCSAFQGVDEELDVDVGAVQKVAAKHQRINRTVNRMNPSPRNEECLSRG